MTITFTLQSISKFLRDIMSVRWRINYLKDMVFVLIRRKCIDLSRLRWGYCEGFGTKGNLYLVRTSDLIRTTSSKAASPHIYE